MNASTYKKLVPCPARTAMNSGLSPAKVATLKSIFGPFPQLTNDCEKVRNQKVARLLETRNVGPFRATGIKPALDDLTAIFKEIKEKEPDLYELIETAGMTCYRCVRGVPNTPSNHAAGTAVDLKIDGVLSEFDADEIPQGLVSVYKYFHAKKWYWGAGYRGRRDSMHFEASNELLLKWDKEGKI